MAAAKYLRTLSKMFDGDWHLALASYNGGPGRMQRAIKRAGGVEDFWKLAARKNLLPRETREYVPMILAAIVIARNPAQYGFDFEPRRRAEYEKVTLTKPVDLRRIAEWAETTIDEIQALNPELRRWTTPVRDAQYELKVPAGTAERVSDAAGRRGGDRSGDAQLAHRQARRDARDDCQEAECQPERSRRPPTIFAPLRASPSDRSSWSRARRRCMMAARAPNRRRTGRRRQPDGS